MENYSFNKEEFLSEIENYPPNKPISWTRLAKKYNGVLGKQHPPNTGQVLMQFAKSKGLDVYQLNKSKRISGRDYLRRVRRTKIKLKNRISNPRSQISNKTQTNYQKETDYKKLNIGEKIAPKMFLSTKIDDSGKLVCRENTIFGRKYPLLTILTEEIQRFTEAGVLRTASNERADEDTRPNEDTQNILHIKVWHDHSETLNQPYVNFMVSFLYDIS